LDNAQASLEAARRELDVIKAQKLAAQEPCNNANGPTTLFISYHALN
jgi:hypothetical protein